MERFSELTILRSFKFSVKEDCVNRSGPLLGEPCLVILDAKLGEEEPVSID